MNSFDVIIRDEAVYSQQWPQDWKRSVCISTPKKGKAKEYSNYHTIALISHAKSNAQNCPSQASAIHEP